MQKWAPLAALVGASSLIGLVGCSACEEQGLTVLVPLGTPAHDLVDFGFVYIGDRQTRTTSLRSSGSADLEVDGVRLEGSSAFSQHSSHPAVVEPGDSLEVSLNFAPGEESVFNATLLFTTNADQSPNIAVDVIGRGLALPDCDDHNPCTLDSFDYEGDRCQHADREGDCDDLSACTEDDRCVDGECLGEAVTCSDGNPCTQDLCSAETGCTYVADASICDDGNACSIDSCDPVSGCQSTAAPDGIPCGPVQGCVAIPLCLGGACNPYPVPDGTPCSDGNYCTLADRCASGVCQGTPAQRPPEVVARLQSYGSAHSRAGLMGGGRILFADGHGYPGDWDFTPIPGTTLTLVQVSQSGLTQLDQIELDATAVDDVVAFAPGTAVLVEKDSGRLHFVSIGPSGTLQARGSVDVEITSEWPTTLVLAATPPYLYAAQQRRPAFYHVDASDLDAPTVVSASFPGVGIEEMAVDPTQQRLLIATTHQGLRTYDISNPLLPATLALGLFDAEIWRVEVSGDLVVVDEVGCAACNRLHIHRASDLAELSEIGFPPHFLYEFGLYQNRLVALRDDENTGGWFVDLYDLTDPSQPDLIGSHPLSDDFLGFADKIMKVGERTAVFNGMSYLTAMGHHHRSSHVLDFDPGRAGDPFLEVSGPGHGTVHTLVARPAGIYALAPDSVHRIEISQNSAGFWAAGAVLPSQASLFRLAGTGVVPTHVVVPGEGYQYGSNFSHSLSSWSGTWVNAEDPSATSAVGSAAFDRMALLLQNGHFVFALGPLDMTPQAALGLLVYDLGPLELGFDMLLEPAASLDLGREAVYHSATSGWLDQSAARVAIAVNDLWLAGGTPEFKLYLLDVSDPLQPSLIVVDDLDQAALSVASDGTTTVVLESDATDGLQAFSGHTLRIFDSLPGAPTGTLSERGSTPLADSNHIMAFDGSTAFIATRDAVAVVDVSAQPPLVLARIQTPQAPISAAFASDHLYVGSQAAITVVHPPCANQ